MPMRFLQAITICTCLASAWCQTEQPKAQLTARELFYAAREEAAKPKPAAHRPAAKSQAKAPAAPAGTTVSAGTSTVTPPAVSPSSPSGGAQIIRASYSTVPLGLRYTVLKRSADGTAEVSPSTVFHSGDRIQLAVEVDDAGYLYVVTQGSSGTWEVLFPSSKIEGGDNRVESHHRYVVPQNYVFSFAGKPGVEKLFIIFSRQRESEIDRLIYSLQGGKPAPSGEPAAEPAARPKTLMASAAPLDDALVGQFRQLYSRDLIIEKAEEETSGQKHEDKAVYVVNPKGAADSRVVADIQFTHQ